MYRIFDIAELLSASWLIILLHFRDLLNQFLFIVWDLAKCYVVNLYCALTKNDAIRSRVQLFQYAQ